MSIDAVLWDYGHTLEDHTDVDWNHIAHRLLQTLAQRYHEITGLETCPDSLRARFMETIERHERETAATGREYTVAQAVMESLPSSAPRLSEQETDKLVIASLCAYPPFPTFPHARETLMELKTMGLQQAIVSNMIFSPRFLEINLRRQGLNGPFDALVCSSQVGWRKPHAPIFCQALKLLGVAADRTLFVGDSLRFDVLGAAQAGMLTVWRRNTLDQPFDDATPDYTIDSLSELPQIVRNLSSGTPLD